MRRSWYFVMGGIAFGVLFWFVDSLLNYFFFYKFEITAMRPPAHEIYVRIIVFVLFVISGVVMAKIYARYSRNRELLENATNIWARTFDSLGQAVSVHTKDFTVVNANKSMCGILGKTRDEVIGSKCYELLHHSHHPIEGCPCLLTHESGESEMSEFYEPVVGKWIKETTAPILDDHGKMFAFVHMMADITEQKERERELHEQISLYEKIVDSPAEAIVVVQDEKLVFASKPMEKIMGYSHDELFAKQFADFVHPDDRSIVLERHRQYLEGKLVPTVYPFRVMTRDGDVRWLEINTTIIDWDANPAMLAIVEDATERMQQQSRLQQGLMKYSQLLSNMTSGVIVYEAVDDGEEYIIKEINKAAERIEGIGKEEVVGKNVRDVFPHMASSGLIDVYREVWKTGRPSQRFREITTPEGQTGWRVNYVQRLQTNEIADMFEDVTEQRRTELAREEMENRYRVVMNNANEAIFIAEGGKFMLTNPKVSTITGYLPEELASKEFADLIHQDDQAMVIEHYEKRLKGETSSTQAPFRLVDKGGHVHWVEINAVRITWDEKPATLNFLSDVTDRWHAEEELRESEERFRKLNEASFEGVIIHEDGVIVDANTPAMKLLGYAWQEARGSRLVDVVAPACRHVIADIVRGLFDTPREVEFIQSDSTHVLAEVRGKEMPYLGRTVGVLAVRDVEERKQAEGEIRKRMAEIERLNEYLVGREMRIIEIKKEVNELLHEMDRSTRYKV